MCQEGAVYSRVFVLTNKIIIILVFFITVLVVESKIPPSVPWTRESHSSPIRSFIPGLIPFFLQILPTVAFLFFFRTDSRDSPDCLPILLSISVFYILVFLFPTFLIVGSVRQIKLTRVSFRLYVKIAFRIASYWNAAWRRTMTQKHRAYLQKYQKQLFRKRGPKFVRLCSAETSKHSYKRLCLAVVTFWLTPEHFSLLHFVQFWSTTNYSSGSFLLFYSISVNAGYCWVSAQFKKRLFVFSLRHRQRRVDYSNSSALPFVFSFRGKISLRSN